MNNKCQFCDNEACLKIVNIDVNGCIQEAYLCKKHVEERCDHTQGAYQLLEAIPSRSCGIALSKCICPHCGCSKEWVEKTKRFGCPRCYRVFDTLTVSWMRYFKSSSVHLGKIPKHMKVSKEQLSIAYAPRLHFFEAKMQAFVKAEDYEKAHTYRKIIKKILKEKKNASINV